MRQRTTILEWLVLLPFCGCQTWIEPQLPSRVSMQLRPSRALDKWGATATLVFLLFTRFLAYERAMYALHGGEHRV